MNRLIILLLLSGTFKASAQTLHFASPATFQLRTYFVTNVHDLLQPSGNEKLQTVTLIRRDVVTYHYENETHNLTNDIIGQPKPRMLELVSRIEEWRELPLPKPTGWLTNTSMQGLSAIQKPSSSTNWVWAYPKTPFKDVQAAGTTRTNYPASSTNKDAKIHGRAGKVEPRTYVQPTRHP